jgi:hypothetical protein
MKTLYNFILVLSFILLSNQGFSQEFDSKDAALTRKEKKEARQEQLYANYKAIDTLIQNKTFVLEADYLQNVYGEQIRVPSMLNFIKIDSPVVVLQTGSNSYVGLNGVGGITAEGNISHWTVNKDEKHLSYTIRFTTMTNVGTYDIFLRIAADATAQATISGFTHGKLTYKGNLVAPYNSTVYKGYRTM